jgi:hypothetical protein
MFSEEDNEWLRYLQHCLMPGVARAKLGLTNMTSPTGCRDDKLIEHQRTQPTGDTSHCESGEGIWLQGEAASEAHSFRDAEPHPVIPANAKNNHEIFPKKLRPCNNTNLSTTDFCQPSSASEWSVVWYYRICLIGPKNETEYSLLFTASAWLCGSASKWAMKTGCWWGCCR